MYNNILTTNYKPHNALNYKQEYETMLRRNLNVPQGAEIFCCY